jgi:hypothetical protein
MQFVKVFGAALCLCFGCYNGFSRYDVDGGPLGYERKAKGESNFVGEGNLEKEVAGLRDFLAVENDKLRKEVSDQNGALRDILEKISGTVTSSEVDRKVLAESIQAWQKNVSEIWDNLRDNSVIKELSERVAKLEGIIEQMGKDHNVNVVNKIKNNNSVSGRGFPQGRTVLMALGVVVGTYALVKTAGFVKNVAPVLIENAAALGGRIVTKGAAIGSSIFAGGSLFVEKIEYMSEKLWNYATGFFATDSSPSTALVNASATFGNASTFGSSLFFYISYVREFLRQAVLSLAAWGLFHQMINSRYCSTL